MEADDRGAETDVDCGGGLCPQCALGRRCQVSGQDCQNNGACIENACEAPTCSDQIVDGNETDVDCGGGTCAPCPDGDRCVAGADCQSNTCPTIRCVPRVNLVGTSDLTNVTLDMTAKTGDPFTPFFPGAAGIIYSGGPSSVGENAMLAATQTVAPMSMFLDNAVCTAAGAAGSPSTAEGLVVGLNALSILGAQSTAGAPACNGAAADCDPTTDPTAGLAWNTTVQRPTKGSYTFHGWQDVLRVLYGGVSHDPSDTGCDSEIRTYVANNWSSLFENSGCISGTCNQIQHIFRPDDGSEASVLFASLLGLSPTPSASALPPGIPTFTTTCGNGIVEALEQCDNGLANGPPPASCSRIRRTNPQ